MPKIDIGPLNGNHNPVTANIRRNIAFRRDQLGISLKHLSDAAAIDEDKLKEYEAGTVVIPANDLCSIGLALNVQLDFFFSDPASVSKPV